MHFYIFEISQGDFTIFRGVNVQTRDRWQQVSGFGVVAVDARYKINTSVPSFTISYSPSDSLDIFGTRAELIKASCLTLLSQFWLSYRAEL